MDSKKSSRFFQFPIRALRVDCSLLEVDRKQAWLIFDDAIDFAIAEKARKIRELPEDRIVSLAKLYTESSEIDSATASKILSGGHEFLSFAAALAQIGIRLRRLDNSFIKRCSEFRERILATPGSNLQVRVSTTRMFDFRDSWSFREAAVLCAIYAGVGRAPAKILSRQRIRALAMGFSSVSELEELGNGLPLLTDRQIRSTVAKLESLRYFQRGSIDKRNYYYSHRMNREDMNWYLARKLARKSEQATQDRGKEIQELAEQISSTKKASASA